jgi:hypothetical protein
MTTLMPLASSLTVLPIVKSSEIEECLTIDGAPIDIIDIVHFNPS